MHSGLGRRVYPTACRGLAQSQPPDARHSIAKSPAHTFTPFTRISIRARATQQRTNGCHGPYS
eukprot:4463748-Pyramimonas_sp.AAC.1